MTEQKYTFSSENRKELESDFQQLADICFPKAEVLLPTFRFKGQKDLTKQDGLPYGQISNGYYIPPEELKTIWEDAETLRDNHVEVITSKQGRWFYNSQYPAGDFYFEDGTKKVEVEFPFWMDVAGVWCMPRVKKALKSVFDLYEKGTPTETEAQACFPEKLCRQIYEKNPARGAVGEVVLEAIEHLRQGLFTTLTENNMPQILQEKGFTEYISQNSNLKTLSDGEQVRRYLKKNKNAIYLLGEKYGYIERAGRMLRYQLLRDNVRHPDEVAAIPFNPTQVFEDFRIALKMPKQGASQNASLVKFEENGDVVSKMGEMSQILAVLDRYEDKTLKKKNPAYWQDLVAKGVLQASEVPVLQQKIKEYDTVAHGNEGAKTLKPVVADDVQIMDLSETITERHDRALSDLLQRGR